MGFGFNLFFVFVLLPITVILLLIWLLTRKKCFGKTLGFIWLGLISFVFLISIINWLFWEKMEVKPKDIYGTYVIDREKFSGKNADWQYNHFSFEITKNNEFIFYQYNDFGKIAKIYRGKIQFSYNRIKIVEMQPECNIIETVPTLYRNVWSFYYVFNSPLYSNMFFKKGKWKKLQ